MHSSQTPPLCENTASGGARNIWLIDDEPSIDPRSPVFYFDFQPVFDRSTTLRRDPEMIWLMCQNHALAAAPGELVLPREDGFFLVIQTCFGAAAEIIASRVHMALLRVFFGTDCLNKLTSFFRAVPYSDLIEAGVVRGAPQTPRSQIPDPQAEEAAKSNPAASQDEHLLPGCTDLKPGFLPMVSLHTGLPAIYLGGAMGIRGGRMVFGSAPLKNCDPERRTTIDLAILEHSVAFARQADPAKCTAAVAASVSYETLAWSRGRRAYQDALRSSGAFANPFLIIKIDDIPPGTVGSRLAEITAMVRPFAKRVFVQLPDCDSSLIQSCHIGAAGLCITLPANEPPQITTRIATWLSRAATLQHALACVDGIDRPDALPLLRAAGIRYAASRTGNEKVFLGGLASNNQDTRLIRAA